VSTGDAAFLLLEIAQQSFHFKNNGADGVISAGSIFQSVALVLTHIAAKLVVIAVFVDFFVF
jgi:hypothetical protein